MVTRAHRGSHSQDEGYVTRTITVLYVSDKAIKVSNDESEEVWIARSNLSSVSDRDLDDNALLLPWELDLEVRRWALSRAGFDV